MTWQVNSGGIQMPYVQSWVMWWRSLQKLFKGNIFSLSDFCKLPKSWTSWTTSFNGKVCGRFWFMGHESPQTYTDFCFRGLCPSLEIRDKQSVCRKSNFCWELGEFLCDYGATFYFYCNSFLKLCMLRSGILCLYSWVLSWFHSEISFPDKLAFDVIYISLMWCLTSHCYHDFLNQQWLLDWRPSSVNFFLILNSFFS